MAKPNYRHAKKQKEAARKARQDAKHLRKSAPGAADEPASVDDSGADAVEAPDSDVPAASDA